MLDLTFLALAEAAIPITMVLAAINAAGEHQ